MTEVYIPTVADIHRIAYLTAHGWDHHGYDGEGMWSKLGQWRKCRTRTGEPYNENMFCLQDAYEAQLKEGK